MASESAVCPVCDSARGDELADRDGLRWEQASLWEFHLRRLRPGVPVAELTDRVVFSRPPPRRLVRCRGCGTLYRDPGEQATATERRYREETLKPAVLDRLRRVQRPSESARVDRLTRLLGGPGRGLEVGPYAGAFLDAARAAGWRFEGLDVNRTVVAHLRRRGLPARAGTLDDIGDPGDPGAPADADAPGHAGNLRALRALRVMRWDAIVLWTCLDQIPDPGGALRRAASLVRPGGVVAVRVPNGAFYARWRRRLRGPLGGVALRVLAWNNLLGFPYLHGFTVRALRRLLAGSGLRTVAVAGDVLVPLAGAWTRGWAVWEERAVKGALRWRRPSSSPWLEVYARRDG